MIAQHLRSLVGAALLCAAAIASAASAEEPAAERQAPPMIDATSAEILESVRSRDAKVVLVNVWAMWCQPCREEMPHLVAISEAWRERGVEIVLVSVDFQSERDAAGAFLGELGVDFPTFFQAGEDDETFIDGLYAGWSGTLPATLLFNAEGERVQFWEGDASREFFEARILEVLEGRPGFPETTIPEEKRHDPENPADPVHHDPHDHDGGG